MTSGIEPTPDDEIRVVVERLSRPHRSGGRVIERASILAEGARSAAILEWLTEHGWHPEQDAPPVAARGSSGLHGGRQHGGSGRTQTQAPRRYVSQPR